MDFDIDSIRHEGNLEKEINLEGVADKYRQKARYCPVWHIARRDIPDVGQKEETWDIWLKRAENINGQCGPVGTALHGNLLHLPWSRDDSFGLFKLLIEKGADVSTLLMMDDTSPKVLESIEDDPNIHDEVY